MNGLSAALFRGVVLSASLLFALTGGARAGLIIYDGSTAPDSNLFDTASDGVTGWKTLAADHADVGDFATTAGGVPGTWGFQTGNDGQLLSYYDTQATDFVVSMRVKVENADLNPHDFGLGISLWSDQNASLGLLSSVDRTHSVVITDTGLSFADQGSDLFTTSTTDGFHEFAVRYVGGTIEVFVDQVFADVVNGTAGVAAMTRSGVTLSSCPSCSLGRGIIAFGDNSNDFASGAVNSSYSVDYVMFESLDDPGVVPAPTVLSLMVFALAALGGRPRWPQMAYSMSRSSGS